MSDYMPKTNMTNAGVDLRTPDWVTPDVAVIGQRPEFVQVVCVQSGTEYKQEYVDKLRNSVARNLTIPHSFHAITDSTIPEEDQASWWAKIQLFNPHTFDINHLVLYLDLDVVITGSLDDIVSAKSHHPMIIIENFSINVRHCAYNSSCMLFHPLYNNSITNIWQAYENDKDKIKKVLHGDQCWIWRSLKNSVSVFPQHLIRSYKYHCTRNVPDDTRVVVFHGAPNPEQVRAEWITKNWK